MKDSEYVNQRYDRTVGLMVHFNSIHSDMMNADDGDYDYKMDCKKPVDRYKHNHEEPELIPHKRKIIGLKKIGKVAKARLSA